jgi:GIY-YIG catalytic domain
VERDNLAVAALASTVAVARASLGHPAPLAGAEARVPGRPGLYAIYGDTKTWQELGLGEPPDGRPLYIGKAEDSLVARDLKTHFGDGRTGQSTLRRSFAALLHDTLNLRGIPRNTAKPGYFSNYGLSAAHDAALTRWMRERLQLAAQAHRERLRPRAGRGRVGARAPAAAQPQGRRHALDGPRQGRAVSHDRGGKNMEGRPAVSDGAEMRPAEEAWWTTEGWARHGSQLQTQLYVNRRPAELAAAVIAALPSLAEHEPSLRWVAPLESAGFREPQDVAFLEALELQEHEAKLKEFWPKGGPVWDALALCSFAGGGSGVLLAEGKNYPQEMYSTGSQVGQSGSTRALANKDQIEKAITWAQTELGLPVDARRWMKRLDQARPSSSLYQTANRLAHTLWLRSIGVEAWLCHLLFVGDTRFGYSTKAEWEAALAKAHHELGIAAADIPFAGHAYLPALDGADLLGTVPPAP